MKKIILIVIDGLGDKPIPQLGNKTPLEAAKTPNLDWLANKGICGVILPFQFPDQEKPESDTSHLALLGYDPKKYYLGRGPYEAAGIGLDLELGDVALRVNFATIDSEGPRPQIEGGAYGAGKNLKVIDRRAGRIEKTQPLIEALSGIEIKGIKFLIKKSYGHRAVLVLRLAMSDIAQGIAQGISAKISDSDPKKEGEKIKKVIPLDQSKEAKFTAKVLNKFLIEAQQILKKHPLNKKREKKGLLPANCLLTRGVGFFKKTASFNKRYGLKACCIAGGALYKGIGKILGMDLLKVKGANGFPDTNLRGKILAAKSGLKKYNFVFCHIKAADSLAEDGNFFGKKEFIEKIDKNLNPLFNLKNTLIVVTADHSTCSALKRHCSKPIPLLIYGGGTNGIQEFSEKACQKGKLGKIKQLDLMPKILKLANI